MEWSDSGIHSHSFKIKTYEFILPMSIYKLNCCFIKFKVELAKKAITWIT